MNKARAFWLILTLLFTTPAWAFQSRVVTIPSAAMHKSLEATVVLPDQYARGKAADRFPVVYLLHGSGGDYTDWTSNSQIGKLADRYHVILVMPDGGHESWYIDSPVDPHSRYETYVGTEVVGYVDAHFRTIATRQARAITGLSMGGFGALHIALDRPDESAPPAASAARWIRVAARTSRASTRYSAIRCGMPTSGTTRRSSRMRVVSATRISRSRSTAG